MPTYSYRCTQCGTELDVHQEFSDPALTTCEECGGTLRKLFSPVGVTFSGSGFYRTDSRKESGQKKATSDSSPPSSTPATSSTPSSTSTSTS